MAITFVQSAVGSLHPSQSAGTGLGTFASNITSGNAIVLAIGQTNTIVNGTIVSVTDTQNNTFTRLGSIYNSNQAAVNIYLAQNIAGGTDIITVVGSSPSGQQSFMSFMGVEYSGLSSSPFDQIAFGTGNAGTQITGTTSTTTQGSELLVSAFFFAGSPGTPASGWNMRGTVFPPITGALYVQDIIVSSTGQYAGTLFGTNTFLFAGGVSTFKAVAAVGGFNPVNFINLLGVGQA